MYRKRCEQRDATGWGAKATGGEKRGKSRGRRVGEEEDEDEMLRQENDGIDNITHNRTATATQQRNALHHNEQGCRKALPNPP